MYASGLLFFAIVLGLSALVATITETGRGRHPASPPPAGGHPRTISRPHATTPVTVRFATGRPGGVRRLAAETAATIAVGAPR
jgi:hypothetical protein